ncbi:MAG: VIT domain-containing protein, partial [Verrucomicrobiota bacterium]
QGLLSGMAIATAAYYTLMFITITPFAFLGFAAVIYFGIGLLCFLPLAPLLSLLAASRMHFLLKRHHRKKLPLFWTGILAGLAAIALFSTPMYLTKAGLSMAASDSLKTQSKGIKLLRFAGDEVLMNRACYFGANMPGDPISWLINQGRHVRPEQARNIYYRTTGKAFNTIASPTLGIRTRRNPGNEFDWDPETGGDVVAGRLKGLSIVDSRIDGMVNSDAATAYLEWTMVFHNDWKWEREARAQIALPTGAVVSRLTLWIDGEEREAAFGGRSQVKQAYKKVVRRRRDPVLVTTCGPDRVLMQCYPVPANGDMKIRIGITAPLTIPSETGRSLRLPHLLERNFRIPDSVRHAVWIEDFMIDDLADADLNSSAATIHTESTVSSCWAQADDLTVLQEIKPSASKKPGHLVLVIDSSACMKDHLGKIAASMDSLPQGIPLTVLVADDEPLQISPKDIGRIKACGGKESSAALRKALTSRQPTDVIWIHGPQTWSLDSGEKLRQAMERQSNIRLFDFQVGHGPHRLIEKLDRLSGFHSVPRTANIETDLANLLRTLSGESEIWKAVRTSIGNGNPAVHKTNGHLVRLFALDQIRADLSDGKPGNETALALALKHHLVTPVSGAVVLETQQQYDEANLKPVDSQNVPGVPEPGVLVLFVLAALLLFFGRRMIQHTQTALELK